MSDPYRVHAALMLLAWAVLIPSGILAARFFKVLKSQGWPQHLDNKRWWHWHRGSQYAALVAMLVGLWRVVSGTGGFRLGSTHAKLGFVAIVIAILQVLSGLLRGSKGGPTDPRADRADPSTWRGDHYDMTTRRRVFEFFHKKLGYFGLASALFAAWLGMKLLEVWWVFRALYVAWLCLLAVMFGLLERSGRRVDTFEAIWGPGPHASSRRSDAAQGLSFQSADLPDAGT